MTDIKGLRSSSASPASHQEAWQEPSSVSAGHRGDIQGRWGSCSTAQRVSKPLALETQQRAPDTLHLIRMILVSLWELRNPGMVEVTLIIAGGLEINGLSSPFQPKPLSINTRWEGTSRIICSSPAWPKQNLDKKCSIVVLGCYLHPFAIVENVFQYNIPIKHGQKPPVQQPSHFPALTIILFHVSRDIPENLFVWARHHLPHIQRDTNQCLTLSKVSYLSSLICPETQHPMGSGLFLSGCCCLQFLNC